MQHFGPFSVAIAFWVFLTVSAVAGIVADYKKRGLALEPLRTAIERGQQLDPQVIERLMAPEQRDDHMNPLYLKVCGIVTIAAGVLSDERMARLHAARWPSRASAGAIFATVLAAVATGIRAPLRLRHAGLMALAAAVVTLCSAVLSL